VLVHKTKHKKNLLLVADKLSHKVDIRAADTAHNRLVTTRRQTTISAVPRLPFHDDFLDVCINEFRHASFADRIARVATNLSQTQHYFH